MARSIQTIIPTALLCLVCACASSPYMTRPRFDSIELGTSISEVVKSYGSPYLVRTRPDGSQEYEYIERVMMGEETIEENKYFLIVKNGQIVSKRFNQELPPAYDEIYDPDPNDVEN